MGSFRHRLWSRLLVSLLFGGGFAWLAARGGLPLLPDGEALRRIAPWTIPVYLLSLAGVHLLRASRFRFLIAPVKRLSLGQVISLNFAGFAAIFLLPLRLGEFVRPALGKSRHGIPISTGLGTVAVERVADGLITSLCVAFVLSTLPSNPPSDPVARHLPQYAALALTVFCCAFVALFAFLWQRKLAMALTLRIFGLVSPRLAETLASKVDGIADGLRSIGSPRLLAGFVAESLGYWLVNALGVWALGVGCGLPDFGFGHAVAVMGILAIGILLPSGPGLFGTFQLAVAACLRLYYPDSVVAGAGAVFVFLLYVMQSLVMVVAGIPPLYRSGVPLAELTEAESS